MSNETIPQKNRLQGLQTGVNGSMAAAGAVGQGVSGLGRAIAGAGDTGLKFAMKLQRVKNQQQMSELETSYREQVANYQTTLTPGTDPSKWLQGLEDINKAHKQGTDKMDLPKDVRDEWGLRYNSLSSHYGIKMARDATIMGLQNGKIAFNARVKQLAHEGDYAGVEQAWDSPEAQDLYPSEYRAAAVEENTRIALDQTIVGEIDVDPTTELEAIQSRTGKYENMPVDRLNDYEAQARTTARKREAEAIEWISGQKITSEEQLQTMVDRYKISDHAKKRIMDGYKSNKPASHDEKIRWRKELDALRRDTTSGKINENEHYNRYNKLKAEIYAIRRTDTDVGRFKTMLGGVSPYSEHGNEGKGVGGMSKKTKLTRDYAADIIDRKRDNDVFGTYHINPEDYKTKDPRTGAKNNPATLQDRKRDNLAADRKAAIYVGMVEQYLRRKPDATDTDIENFIHQITGEEVMSRAIQLLPGKNGGDPGVMRPTRSSDGMGGIDAPPATGGYPTR